MNGPTKLFFYEETYDNFQKRIAVAAMMRRITRMPPTTPPTIGPTFVPLPLSAVASWETELKGLNSGKEVKG